MNIELLLSALLYGCISGIGVAVISVGFFLYLRYIKFLNFSYAAFISIAPYIYYLVAKDFSFPAIALTLLVLSILSLIIELAIFSILRRKWNSTLGLLIASFGIYIILVSLLSLLWGPSVKTLESSLEGSWSVMGVRLTKMQSVTALVELICLFGVWVFLAKTKQGRILSAVASNPSLALSVGIDLKNAYLIVTILATCLAGLAGIVIAFDSGFQPLMGDNYLFLGAVSVVVGGITFWGSVVAGIAIVIMQNLAVIWLSPQFKDGVTFSILIAYLIFKSLSYLTNEEK